MMLHCSTAPLLQFPAGQTALLQMIWLSRHCPARVMAGPNTPHSPRLVVTKSSKVPSQASCHWLWPTGCHGCIIYHILTREGGDFFMFIIFHFSLVLVIRKFKILFWGNIRNEGDTPVVCATLHTDQELLSALKNSSNQWMHNNQLGPELTDGRRRRRRRRRNVNIVQPGFNHHRSTSDSLEFWE